MGSVNYDQMNCGRATEKIEAFIRLRALECADKVRETTTVRTY